MQTSSFILAATALFHLGRSAATACEAQDTTFVQKVATDPNIDNMLTAHFEHESEEHLKLITSLSVAAHNCLKNYMRGLPEHVTLSVTKTTIPKLRPVCNETVLQIRPNSPAMSVASFLYIDGQLLYHFNVGGTHKQVFGTLAASGTPAFPCNDRLRSILLDIFRNDRFDRMLSEGAVYHEAIILAAIGLGHRSVTVRDNERGGIDMSAAGNDGQTITVLVEPKTGRLRVEK